MVTSPVPVSCSAILAPSLVVLPGTARGIGALRGRVRLGRVDELAVTVLVVVANPRHGIRQPIFVAPFWRKAQPVVRPDQRVEPAAVTRIRVEYAAGPVVVEHAHTGPFFARKLLPDVVVVHLPFHHLLLGERHVVVAV